MYPGRCTYRRLVRAILPPGQTLIGKQTLRKDPIGVLNE